MIATHTHTIVNLFSAHVAWLMRNSLGNKKFRQTPIVLLGGEHIVRSAANRSKHVFAKLCSCLPVVVVVLLV